MTTMAEQTAEATVRRSITVNTGVERAFRVFTDGIDTWWPRSHHIGRSPLARAVIEPFVGGRWYGEEEDGTQCPWAQITAWEPPHRLVFAWQITADWKYEPDLSKTSEVEVRFTALADGSTRVDLEHRRFDRMGPSGETMRAAVGRPGGWGTLLSTFADRAQQTD
jgi:uncharacterized protein YndB with AHSA1/START domain